jgi:uridine phosphorylase
MRIPPILDNKNPGQPSVFAPAALLREARRQKRLQALDVPSVCILDPDSDLVRHLRKNEMARPFHEWPCYHTELDTFEIGGERIGIVGRVVGASFATLIAEQLFVSGCKFLINLTSAGQIVPAGQPPYFVIVERALRDEGTSYHYKPPSEFAHANAQLIAEARAAIADSGLRVVVGASWTTDAPFRETAEAIKAARAKNILAVEMEAAALYAFSEAKQKPVLCVAHVSNAMAQTEGDFEKGEADGAADALRLLSAIIRRLAPK